MGGGNDLDFSWQKTTNLWQWNESSVEFSCSLLDFKLLSVQDSGLHLYARISLTHNSEYETTSVICKVQKAKNNSKMWEIRIVTPLEA